MNKKEELANLQKTLFYIMDDYPEEGNKINNIKEHHEKVLEEILSERNKN